MADASWRHDYRNVGNPSARQGDNVVPMTYPMKPMQLRERVKLDKWMRAYERRQAILKADEKYQEICRQLFAMPKTADHWMLNGRKKNPECELWRHLVWRKAWMDNGPSPAGNVGPYWHVPVKKAAQWDWGMAHRLYPRGRLAAKARAIVLRTALAEKGR